MMRSFVVAILLAAAGFAWEEPARAATGDVRIDHPTVDGALIDWCVTWGRGCGWDGAHAFCRERGYDHATHFEIARPGRTFLPNGNRFCTGPDCAGFTTVICRPVAVANPPPPPPPPAPRARFDLPQHHGRPVDWCSQWGQDCGWGGANYFCQTQGYRRAIDWSVHKTGISVVLSESTRCRGPGCTAFRHVVCEGETPASSED
jgi:hypothetical protein